MPMPVRISSLFMLKPVHILDRTVYAFGELGCKAGVALNSLHPPDCLAYVLDRIDLFCDDGQSWLWRTILHQRDDGQDRYGQRNDW